MKERSKYLVNKCSIQSYRTHNDFFDPLNFRIIELSLLTTLIFFKVFIRSQLRTHSSTFFVRCAFILGFYIASVVDIVISLYKSTFPYVNFCLRPLLLLIINRGIREEILSISKVVYRARTVFIFLFLNLFLFSLFAHWTFKSAEFVTFFSSLETMFVLVTLNNFPDLMLQLCSYSYYSSLFFIIFVCFNKLLIMGILQAVYFEKYNELMKVQVCKFIKKFRNAENDNDSLNSSFDSKVYFEKMSKQYGLRGDEIDMLNKILSEKKEQMIEKLKFKRSDSNFVNFEKTFFSASKKFPYEVCINLINLIGLLFSLAIPHNWVTYIYNLALCFYFTFEMVIIIRICGLIETLRGYLIKLLNSVINLIILIYFVKQLVNGSNVSNRLLMVRLVRAFVILYKFEFFKGIKLALKNFKKKFFSMLLVLFFIYSSFTTVMSLFFGGKTRFDTLDDTS